MHARELPLSYKKDPLYSRGNGGLILRLMAHSHSQMTSMPNSHHTLIDLLDRNARSHQDSPALIFEGHSYAHAALHQAVQIQAAALQAAGVRRGDRVLVLSGNRLEVLVLLGAVAWLGAMLVPLNLRLSPAEMAQQARDAGPALVIVDAGCASLWAAAWPDGMPGVPLETLSEPVGGSFVCAGQPRDAHVPRQDAPDLGVIMLYTAAVDGHARGAVLSQAQLRASALQTCNAWTLGVHDRWLGVLPLFHAAGIGLALALLEAGGACVILPRFDPAAAMAAVAHHHITVCATFAPMLGALLDAATNNQGEASLASLRVCMGLEPPEVLGRLATLCPAAKFWSAYGQAEVSSMVCLGLQSDRPGAAGRPMAPTEVRVQDAAGRALPAGLEGEIAVRGPTVFLGYWEPEAQRPFKPADPWHRTGDLGRIDEDGWLWFTGRAAHKQLIKTGGENVYPAEVEQVLLEHPAVAEAYVFGKPDAKWGEAVHAVCALKAGSTVTEAELLSHLEIRIARYKKPQSLVFSTSPLQRNTKG
jgi:acyl-CoA synthetase (AMP-forming)/AMP-acid ligase II